MNVQITCDNCNTTIDVADPTPGQKVACPRCGDVNVLRGAGPGTASVGTPARRDAAPAREDRASVAGYPPATGPEVDVLRVRPALFRAHPLLVTGLTLIVVGGAVGAVVAATTALIPVAVAAAVAALVALGVLVVMKIKCLGEGLVITTKRTIDREGLLRKTTSEVLHIDIRNVQVVKGVWERLWRVGTLSISSAADDVAEVRMRHIPSPDRVRAIIDLYRNL